MKKIHRHTYQPFTAQQLVKQQHSHFNILYSLLSHAIYLNNTFTKTPHKLHQYVKIN